MRTPKNVYEYESRTLEVEQTHCDECANRLHACNCIRRRPLQTLHQKWLIALKDKVCRTPGCPLYGKRLCPPAEAELPILKRKGFGLDVVAWIGEKRTTGERSLPEVHAALLDEFGISISERHVSNLFAVFLALVHCVDADAAPLREKLIQQGRISLSIDGVHFDDTSPVLYVLRDTISRRVLYSERLFKADTARLCLVLRKVKDIGVPIIGVVSDKEQTQVLAVAQELPGVSHQYCQTHFLKNVAKQMETDLSTLAEATADAATSLRKLEKELPQQAETRESQAELDLAKKLCVAARTGSKASGDGILDPTALKRFERLEAVIGAAEDAIKEKTKPKKRGGQRQQAPARTCPYLTAVLGALVGLRAQVALARRLDRQVVIVRKVAHILKLMTSGSQVKRILAAYLNQLLRLTAAQDPSNPLGRFIHHLDAVADRYWPGLFHCYDTPDLPANNNDLEQQFGRFKRAARKATGRKSTAGGPLETCAEFLLEAWDAIMAMPNLKDLLKEVTYAQLQAAMDKMASLSEPARIKRRIQRNPDAFLAEALEEWRKS
jgi:hypothetical protein